MFRKINYSYKSILICTCFWLIGMALGLNLELLEAEMEDNPYDKSFIGWDTNFHPILNILINNMVYAGSLLFLGILTSGLFSIITFVFNGFVLGLFINKAIVLGMGFSKLFVLVGIHGPLEIAAFVLIGSLTFRGWTLFKQCFTSKPNSENLNFNLGEIYIPLILLLITAPIEFYVYSFNL